MSEPLDFVWKKEPLTRFLARRLRRTTQGQSIDGQRFRFEELAELWSAGYFAAATHRSNPSWLLFHAPDGGNFELASVHPSLLGAQAASIEDVVREPGTYLLARFPGRRWLRVPITSSTGMEVIGGIFKGMGCEVSSEVVGG
jgi:hypothetical protein